MYSTAMSRTKIAHLWSPLWCMLRQFQFSFNKKLISTQTLFGEFISWLCNFVLETYTCSFMLQLIYCEKIYNIVIYTFFCLFGSWALSIICNVSLKIWFISPSKLIFSQFVTKWFFKPYKMFRVWKKGCRKSCLTVKIKHIFLCYTLVVVGLLFTSSSSSYFSLLLDIFLGHETLYHAGDNLYGNIIKFFQKK